MNRVNLLQNRALRALLIPRWPQLGVQLAALAGLGILIAVGLVGSPVGNRNLAIVVVWIAWWALLMLMLVPFFGRLWCSVCPIPLPGEWLQRGAVLGPTASSRGSSGEARAQPRRRGLRWPSRLRNLWLQNATFVGLALTSLAILTQPRTTAWVLIVLVGSAIVVSLVFERRSFCRFLCPVGGVIGLYSQGAPLEVRVVDRDLCTRHIEKTCYTGSDQGYGCPWQVFPATLRTNVSCGTCFECLRTCPYDNVAVNLRPFGEDLFLPGPRRLDETFKALVLLGSVVTYAAVMLGPWGELKAAAAAVGTTAWLVYAGTFLVVTLAIAPGLYWIATSVGRAFSRVRATSAQVLRAFTPALVPLGITAWGAFSVSFLLANLSYLWPALSDPFASGWNLLGAAGVGWSPYASGVAPALQLAILLVGLTWAGAHVRRIADELGGGLRLALPVLAFTLVPTLGLMWLLVG